MSNKLTYDITSLNVRGLREQNKRRNIFSYLKDEKSKLCFLQETYSEVNDEIIWRNEWGGKKYFFPNSLMLSLCNIYVPNNQAEQLEFLQELNNCLIDKSELTTLIVGGDWNCTFNSA